MTPVWTIRYRAGGTQHAARVIGSRLAADRLARLLPSGFVVPPEPLSPAVSLALRVAVNIELHRISEAVKP